MIDNLATCSAKLATCSETISMENAATANDTPAKSTWSIFDPRPASVMNSEDP